MVRVKVINGTEEEIVIKEGNAGIYREVQKVIKGGIYVIHIDENATYREFVCVETKSGLTVTLTSDDCIDFAKVEIKSDENKTKLYFEPTLRKPRSIIDVTTDANIGKSVKGATSWIAGYFRKK